MTTVEATGAHDALDTADAAHITIDPDVIRHAAALLDMFDHDPRLSTAEVLDDMCANAAAVAHPNPAAPHAYRLAARVAGLVDLSPDPLPAGIGRPACGWCSEDDSWVDYRVQWNTTDATSLPGDESCCAHCLPEVVAHATADPFRAHGATVEVTDLAEAVAA